MPKSNVGKLKSLIARLDKQIEALEVERHAAHQELLMATATFAIGDIITWKERRAVRRGRVVGFYDWGGSESHPVATVIRADGSDGQTKKIWREVQLAQDFNPPKGEIHVHDLPVT